VRGFSIATVLATPAQAQLAPEVQVSTVAFGDLEFDWGRDGTNCPTCNFGQGNSRFSWTDRQGNRWVGCVDFNTGLFRSPAGNNELVDTTAAF
jgi:hypothetical protein